MNWLSEKPVLPGNRISAVQEIKIVVVALKCG